MAQPVIMVNMLATIQVHISSVGPPFASPRPNVVTCGNLHESSGHSSVGRRQPTMLGITATAVKQNEKDITQPLKPRKSSCEYPISCSHDNKGVVSKL
jgi:hypothetical protein